MRHEGTTSRGQRHGTTWRRGGAALLLTIAALTSALIVDGVSQADGLGELLSPQQAAENLGATDPSAVGGDGRGDASVDATSTGFEVTGAKVDVMLPKSADEPMSIETRGGTLKVEPVGVSSIASDGEAVNGDSAVVYANTGKDSDTSVVPNAKGVETFTSIRSEDAKEDYSVKVDLPGDVQLEQIDDTSVALIDPSPAKPSDDDLPAPAAPGTPQAAKAREISGLADVKDADPDAAADARAGAQAAGLTRPDVIDSQVRGTKPDLSMVNALRGRPPSGLPDADSGAFDDGALDAAKAKTEQQAKAIASDALEQASSAARMSTASANRNNAAGTADAPVTRTPSPAPRRSVPPASASGGRTASWATAAATSSTVSAGTARST